MVRQHKKNGWLLLFIWFLWLNQTNQIDQINQTNQVRLSASRLLLAGKSLRG